MRLVTDTVSLSLPCLFNTILELAGLKPHLLLPNISITFNLTSCLGIEHRSIHRINLIRVYQ